MDDEPSYPEGRDFLKGTVRMEHSCETKTDRALRTGSGAPRIWAHLGTGLSLLDRLASCHWGCGGGDHTAEHLVLRALNSIRAAVHLMRAGFYDEALSVLRSASEIVNLLDLFQYDQDAFNRWRRADAAARWKQLGAGGVRKALEDLGHPSLLDQQRYGELSRLVHGTATDGPQSYNPHEVSMSGGHFQEGGFLVVLSETAKVTALLLLPATSLIAMTRERWHRLHDAARLLVENTDFVVMKRVADAAAGAPAPNSAANSH